MLIDYQFQKADNFSDEIARVLTPEGRYAYINRGGVIVFVTPFDYSFSSSDGAVCGTKNGLYGYCDTTGGIIIHPQFDMAYDFCEGFAAVKFGGKWGYISTGGEYLVRPTYTHASDFKNGYAVCGLSSGYGIIDSQGNRTSAFNFDHIGKCDDAGRFPAKSGSKVGYINARGKWLMELDYDFCYTFSEGVARVYKDNLWGYINENGEELVSPKFADCGDYKNGRAFYSSDGVVYGFVTLDIYGSPDVPEPPAEEFVPPQENTYPTPTDQWGNLLPDEDYIKNTDGTVIIDYSQVNNLPSSTSRNSVSLKIGSKYLRINSQLREISHPPVLDDGVTMVPVRDVVEAMGGTVAWNAETQRLSINCNRTQISMTINSKNCYVNGISKTLTAPPMLVDGITMVPARSLYQVLGCSVEWVAATQNIFIRY